MNTSVKSQRIGKKKIRLINSNIDFLFACGIFPGFAKGKMGIISATRFSFFISSGKITTVSHRGHFFAPSESSTPHFTQYAIFCSFYSDGDSDTSPSPLALLSIFTGIPILRSLEKNLYSSTGSLMLLMKLICILPS